MAAPAPLLFDLDGTLVDSARAIAAALSTVTIARGGHRITAEAVRPLVSRGVGTVVATSLGEFAGDPQADIAEFRAVLAALAAEPTDPYPGVPAMLAALQAAGHAMAIVTNKPEGLARILLRELALDSHFSAVVGGDTCTVAKPLAAPLQRALGIIAPGRDPADAIMIGDSDVDGEAAQAAGCRFILFEGGYGPVSAGRYSVDARLCAFDQIDPVLAKLSATSLAGAG
jgi:phosphoglycolate phosphatase